MDISSPEELAQVYNLMQINVRIAILAKIIEEAKADGDDRWRDTARPQAEALNEARGIVLKRTQDIPPTVIECKVGEGRAIGVTAHG